MPVRTTIRVHDSDTVVTRHVPRPHNCVEAALFTHYGGPPDPAGLCDGGDYHHQLTIRLEGTDEKPMVFIGWNEYEDDDTWQNVTLSYTEFWDAVVGAMRKLKGGDA